MAATTTFHGIAAWCACFQELGCNSCHYVYGLYISPCVLSAHQSYVFQACANDSFIPCCGYTQCFKKRACCLCGISIGMRR